MSGRNYGLNFWENEKDKIIKLYFDATIYMDRKYNTFKEMI